MFLFLNNVKCIHKLGTHKLSMNSNKCQKWLFTTNTYSSGMYGLYSKEFIAP